MPAATAIRLSESHGRGAPNPIKIAYLFTTFPKRTETFLQREIRGMRRLSVELELFSLWGGEKEFEGHPVHRFPKWRLITLLWWLPYWLCHKPLAFAREMRELAKRPVRSWKNLGETLNGLAFAICHVHRLSREPRRPGLINAPWATMPGSAALMIRSLTGIPFSVGAHAYDVFQNGGDWVLHRKLQRSSLIVTSTESTRAELIERGTSPGKLVVVRRGLDSFPAMSVPRASRSPLRILSVARLVDKKGFFDQLDIHAALKRGGIPFEARIVGDGPLAKALRARADSLGLSSEVFFPGSLPFGQVLEHYTWADVFVFTGKVADDGDRDGLPNVIPEAMASGTPVVSTDIGGIAEVIRDHVNGILLPSPSSQPQAWIDALLRLRDDDSHYQGLAREARAWVEQHFDARVNAGKLLEHFCSVGRAITDDTTQAMDTMGSDPSNSLIR